MKNLILIVVLMPLMALAYNTWTDPKTGITWTYVDNGDGTLRLGGGSSTVTAVPKDTKGELVIPASIVGLSVSDIDDDAFYGCKGLESVAIPSSVMSIGNYAFANCSGLASVTIPEGVTSIGSSAFSYCSGLKSITIPSSVTSIGDYAFNGCSGLMAFIVDAANPNYSSRNGLLCPKDGTALIAGINGDVTIPEGVTDIMDRAFYDYSGLTSVTMPSSVTSIGRAAFSYCAGLTSVTIPEGVTSIGDELFVGCTGLTSVTIPEGVTSIGEYAFWGCSGLVLVTIPSSVTSIGDWAFEGCWRLVQVDIVDLAKWCQISFGSGANPLEYANNLVLNGEVAVDLVIPEGVTSIGDFAFCNCSGLISVTIPSSVTSIGWDAFCNCSGLISVTIPSSVTSIGWDAFGDCSGLTSVMIAEGVTSIGGYAFYNCSGLTSVTIPSSVTSIGEWAFDGCRGLTSDTIPSGVASIGDGAFSGCSGLTGVEIPSGVTRIGDCAFYDCSGLTLVTIPSSVTSIEDSAFNGCSKLMAFAIDASNPNYSSRNGLLCSKDGTALIAGINGDVTIPEGVTDIMDRAFFGCSGLTSVTISSGVTSIGDWAFSYCAGLTSVTILEGVTSIGDYAFSGCSGLMAFIVDAANQNYSSRNGLLCSKDGTSLIAGINGDVTIPDGVTSIEYCAFYDCSGLISVTIPSSVTSIGDYAFSGCSGLMAFIVDAANQNYSSRNGLLCAKDGTALLAGINGDVTIPYSVTSIGYHVFQRCTGLTSVTIPSSVTSIEDSAFNGNGCSGLMAFMVDAANPNYSSRNGLLCSKDGTSLIAGINGDVTIPESVTDIFDWAFCGCIGLTSVTIPSSVTSIGHGAFEHCTSLEVIHVSNDGGIDALKQMLYESGFDVESVTFDHVEEPVYVYYKVAFNAQGGVAERTETEVREGEPIGELPTAGRDRYEFLGWFTSAVGGTQVMSATVVTKDVTFYAHWKRIGSTADEEVIAGEKVTIETGLVGYKATGLPKGLSYSKTTGKITGAASKPTATEGVVVKFTKKNAADEEITIAVRAEDVSVGCEGLSNGSLPAGVVGASEGIDLQIYSEGGTKSVSVSKLPAGMKYDSKKDVITGAPSKAGNYEVTLTVTTKYGTKEAVKIPVSVAAMPVMAVGKFDGFVSVGEDNFGTFTLTTTDAGKLTAKVITAAGTVSFSGTCWDSVADGVYRATLTTKKGEKLMMELDSNAGWDENQLTGEFTFASGRVLGVTAQKNAFGKTWYLNAVGDATAGWTFSYAENAKTAALTLTLNADGSTKLAGKLPNGTDAKGKAVTIKVSASGYANVGGMRDGAIMADFAPVVTVNKVKKVLAITTNLWFDRKNGGHDPAGIGSARFVD